MLIQIKEDFHIAVFYEHCSGCDATCVNRRLLSPLEPHSSNLDFCRLMAFLSLTSHVTFEARSGMMVEAVGNTT